MKPKKYIRKKEINDALMASITLLYYISIVVEINNFLSNKILGD